MPIFEDNDEITAEEGLRQQKDLNDKVFRKTVSNLFASQELQAAWDAADKSEVGPSDLGLPPAAASG